MSASNEKHGLIQRVYGKFLDLRISAKIILFYLVLLVFSVVVSSILYQEVYFRIMLGRVNELSMETLYSIEQNINTMLDNVNVYSKLIISNTDIRESLNSDRPDAITKIGKSMQGFMETVPVISSVYIIDNYGHHYTYDREQSKDLSGMDVKGASWYDKALRKNGGYILSLNCGGFLSDKNSNNFISFIRIFNDVYSQDPLGALIINIPEENFANAYRVLMKNYNTSFMLLDENNQKIVSYTGIEGLDIENEILTVDTGNKSIHTEKINKKEYLISRLKLQKQNWNIISITPMSEMLQDSQLIYYISVLVFIVNSLMLFAGSIFISRMITKPIKKLLQSMKGVEEGRFELADVRTGRDEIGKLGNGYNIMITKIKSLIDKVVEDQRIKRKAEFNVLQAQIKPHFLYNTFDSISFLALSGRINEVYEVVTALGSFYRSSLSKGNDIVTISQEIETVKNYLIIQKVRYGKLFTDSYDIDETAGKCRIPKLVLQPLAENALYHGIKPKGEEGRIIISAKHMADHIELTVEDDGVGMDGEQLSRLKNGTIGSDDMGFGLRGTIERLKIYYNAPDVCQIVSKPGEGTKIILKIPLTEEDRNEQ